MKVKNKKIAFGLTSSFYTFNATINEMEKIVSDGGEILPIMSKRAYFTDSRYGTANDFINRIEDITKNKIMISIEDIEGIDADIMVIAPCSGNNIAKFSSSIYDTTILVGIRNLLRKNTPILIGIVTKDGLSADAENIGKLLNRKNVFFIPFTQDNPITKPNSLAFSPKHILPSIEYALEYKQIQPLLL